MTHRDWSPISSKHWLIQMLNWTVKRGGKHHLLSHDFNVSLPSRRWSSSSCGWSRNSVVATARNLDSNSVRNHTKTINKKKHLVTYVTFMQNHKQYTKPLVFSSSALIQWLFSCLLFLVHVERAKWPVPGLSIPKFGGHSKRGITGWSSETLLWIHHVQPSYLI